MEVFFTSPWVPAEWIKAHGLTPRGIWLAEHLAEDPGQWSAGVCAFAQSVVRLAEDQTEAAFIFTTHCDQLRRGFDAAEAGAGLRVFLFNLPATSGTEAARRIFRSELERLGRFLMTLGGHAPSADGLMSVLRQHQRARSELIGAAHRFSGREYAAAVARFHWDGSVTLPPEARPGHDNSIPVALVGGPLPRCQWHLFETVERAGGRVALNATEAGERSLLPVFTPEELSVVPAALEALLARGYLDHCTDVFQRPNTALYTWLNERIAARGVRGIVLWHFVGCDLWRAEAQTLRETFGLRVLVLEGSGNPSDAVRNDGRIEAFLEALMNRW